MTGNNLASANAPRYKRLSGVTRVIVGAMGRHEAATAFAQPVSVTHSQAYPSAMKPEFDESLGRSNRGLPVSDSIVRSLLETEIALGSNTQEFDKMKQSDARLSARERAIVRMMGHGLSNKTIARELSIAPETVKSHAKSIFWKLTVRSRAEAVYRAVVLGLV